MIFLFSDFGLDGPYVGQVEAVIRRGAPDVPVINLFADAPAFDPRLSAYLLAAYMSALEPGDVLLAIVDPGVGTERVALVLRLDGHWLVGPDNGLFELALRRAKKRRAWHIAWRPPALAASFHGRDLFAPVAATLAQGDAPPGPEGRVTRFPDWPDDLAAVVYVDRYGNAMTGLRAASLGPGTELEVAGRRLARARVFGDVASGTAFWYENANGLAEIAANAGSAARELGLAPGSEIRVLGG